MTKKLSVTAQKFIDRAAELDEIVKSTEQIKRHIVKHDTEPEQLLLSFMPTQMTRTSPFFPMKRNEPERHLKEPLVQQHSWGKITISGWRLSIYDESVLLSLLHLFKKHGTETFNTTRHTLCKLMNVTPARDTYNALWKSLCRLTETSVRLELWERKEGKRSRIRRRVHTILSGADQVEKSGKILIALNPFFTKSYAEGLLTGINLGFRRALKGDCAKALYRFFESQKDFHKEGKFVVGLIKLCQAINLKTEGVEKFILRRRIRTALGNLRKHSYLERWVVRKDDTVTVWKSKKPVVV